MTKEPDYKIFSINTSKEIIEEIEQIALQENRSRNFIINLAIKEYVNTHRTQLKTPTAIN